MGPCLSDLSTQVSLRGEIFLELILGPASLPFILDNNSWVSQGGKRPSWEGSVHSPAFSLPSTPCPLPYAHSKGWDWSLWPFLSPPGDWPDPQGPGETHVVSSNTGAERQYGQEGHTKP